MKKKSLVIYLPSLASGGAERLHVTLAPFFIKAGWDVTFLLHKYEGAYCDALSSDVRVVSFDSPRTLLCFWPLVRFLKQEQPDILLSNLGHNNILALWAKLLSRSPTRIIASHHSAITYEVRTSQEWQYKVLPLLCRLFLRFADANVAVSKGTADDLAGISGLPRQQIDVIYNLVDLSNFEDRTSDMPLHPWFQTEEKTPVILAVGRLTPQKSFSTLVDAFAILAKDHPSVRLLILGEGPLLGSLQMQARELGVGQRIDFAGFRPNPLAFMKRAALLVVSSRFEGFGNVLVEALACGTPVVSTNCPFGPAEILEDGKYGKLVPVGDAQQLAGAISASLREPLDHAMLQARGQSFSAEVCAEKYLHLFERLMHD